MRQKYLDEPFRASAVFEYLRADNEQRIQALIDAPELPLFSRVRPPHRRSDPETSREAAEKATERTTATQRAILWLLKRWGPKTDEEIVDDLNRHHRLIAFISPSGCRSRRAELVALGLVRFSGRFGVTAAGNRARIWQAV